MNYAVPCAKGELQPTCYTNYSRIIHLANPGILRGLTINSYHRHVPNLFPKEHLCSYLPTPNMQSPLRGRSKLGEIIRREGNTERCVEQDSHTHTHTSKARIRNPILNT